MRLVLDASVAVKWFVPEPHYREARSLLPRIQSGDVELIAPETVVAEFGHALRKLVVGRKMDAAECPNFVRDFLSLDVRREPIGPLAEDAMRLTTRHMSTFYDALYIALAIREDLRVITADERMVSAFSALDRTISLASFS